MYTIMPQYHTHKTQAMMNRYHTHKPSSTQCGSALVQKIEAPLPLVWSMVRCFSKPQAYKPFIKSCTLKHGDGVVGSVREVKIITGLPAETSMEHLDKLDDDMHVMMFSIIGGDHRLKNYKAVTTVHEDVIEDGDQCSSSSCTVVVESYTVDVPNGSSAEDTCLFANTIVGSNLRSLARIAEKMVSVV